MNAIVNIIGRGVLDPRGNPTVECDVLLESGVMDCAAVPSGASTSSHGTIELRDSGKSRYPGKGVLKAVKHTNTGVSEAIIGLDASEQAFLDHALINLGGTENKSRLDVNVMLAVSMAVAKVATEGAGLPLYHYFDGSGAMQMSVPMMNIISDGAYVNNSPDIQEFTVMSVGQPSFCEVPCCGAEIFHTLRETLADKGMSTVMGDEGGFASNFASNEEYLNTILSAIERAGYKAGEDVLLALDYAAPEFYKGGKYHLKGEGLQLSLEDFIDCLANLADKFPVVLVEDDMHESDWTGWETLTGKLGKETQLMGDDLLVMSTKILKEGIKKGTTNLVPIRISQIGTLTETFAVIKMAKRAGYTATISHHSSEAEDSTIAGIAVGTNAGRIRTGSLSRSDCMTKYNQLLYIEENLGGIANYPGKSTFHNLR